MHITDKLHKEKLATERESNKEDNADPMGAAQKLRPYKGFSSGPYFSLNGCLCFSFGLLYFDPIVYYLLNYII